MATADISNVLKTKTIRQENDYYATDPLAFDVLHSNIKLNKNIWEPACGENFLVNRMKELDFNVTNTDKIDYGNNSILDFLEYEPFLEGAFRGDIVTNPPFSLSLEFAEKGLEAISPGNKLCLFMKIQFLESKKRFRFLKENPPKYIFACSNRILCAKNGNFSETKGTAFFLAWFVWEKGFKGETQLRIVNGG